MLKAPFPWFGGKRLVAPLVWERLGDVASYNEPFAGSLAVLLGRPTPARVETVNDVDAYIANAWRAIQGDPDQVAYYADSPVSEIDIHARHRWLVLSNRSRLEQIRTDPNYYNAKAAGWWLHGICAWIGSGWCQTSLDLGAGDDVDEIDYGRIGKGWEQKRRPHLSTPQGINTAMRRWNGGGRGGGSGIHAPGLGRQTEDILQWQVKPDLSGSRGATGRGVHARTLTGEQPWMQRKRPHLTNGGPGADGAREAVGRGVLSEFGRNGVYEWMRALSVRLRGVRVCCYDWRRVLTPSVTTYIGTTGVFLDPPYQHNLRERCYSEDHDISADVRTWALENGDNPAMRIALCGYEEEHGPFMPSTWSKVEWVAHGGYSRSERGKQNRFEERIWFSPHCLAGTPVPVEVELPFE